MSTTITEYSKTDAALADLAARYKNVIFDVLTKDGMASAKESRAILRSYRVELEKIRKEIKSPALLKCQQIDSEAKRITADLEALENPIDAQIKVEENRIENERNARTLAAQAHMIAEAKAIKDAEEAKMAADRLEIARQQAEIALAQKAAREQIEAAECAARLRIEDEERKGRMAREEADRAARKEREAEELKLKIERDRLEAIQRAAEEATRKERDAEELKEREALMLEAKRSDAKNLLKMFVAKYGDLPEFKTVSDAIKNHFTSDVVDSKGDKIK